jgi:hypothetical protein
MTCRTKQERWRERFERWARLRLQGKLARCAAARERGEADFETGEVKPMNRYTGEELSDFTTEMSAKVARD